MSVSYNEAETVVLSSYPDSIILCGMDMPDGYLFSIRPKDWDNDELVLDAFFKVTKNGGKLSEYSPVMNPSEFKNAMKNVIYKR